MDKQRELIINEIGDSLKNGHTGCIVFDFGCYFPYADRLKFDFHIGMEELPDKKLNHRYPNKCYQTISKTYGRRVSKAGYPYYFDIQEGEEQLFLLAVEYGVYPKGADECITNKLLFPVKTNLTAEKPVCGLSLYFNFITKELRFGTCVKEENGLPFDGWTPRYWSNQPDEHKEFGTEMLHFNEAADKFADKQLTLTRICSTTLEPSSVKVEDLFLCP